VGLLERIRGVGGYAFIVALPLAGLGLGYAVANRQMDVEVRAAGRDRDQARAELAQLSATSTALALATTTPGPASLATTTAATIAGENSCSQWGIEVITPRPGDQLADNEVVLGTYVLDPAPAAIQVFVIEGNNQYFHAWARVTMKNVDHQWETRLDVGAPPAFQEIVRVAVIPDSGQALLDRLLQDSTEQGRLPITDWHSDWTTCADIPVRRR
jgi:hypothetical protein